MAKTKKSEADTEVQVIGESLEDRIKAIQQIAKKSKFNLITGSQLESFRFLKVGIPPIDVLGGPCFGRFVVVYGASGSGESTYIYRCIAAAQKEEPTKVAVLLDVEGRIDPTWMSIQGVDLEKLVIVQGEQTLEDYCEAFRRIVQTGGVSIAVIDTVSAMTPKIMFQETLSEHNVMNRDHVAKDAIKIQQFIRLTKEDIFKNNVACVLVAQVRTHGIGSYATHDGLSGGNMLKHMAIQIWCFRAMLGKADVESERITIEGKPIDVIKGFKVKAILEKDTGPNTKKVAFLPFVVGVGYDEQEALINAALTYECIEKSSATKFRWTTVTGEIVEGKRTFIKDFFKSNKVETSRLSKLVTEKHYKQETNNDGPKEKEEEVGEQG